jgi:DNA-binding response OmpR family regulator
MKQKPLLLIVEDDLLLAETMINKFRSVGFTVELAPNGYAGLKFLETRTPQVILLDILLPHTNGFDILSAIKQDERLKQIPVIIASNLDSASDINKGYSLGAGDYIVKSNLSLNELVHKVTFLMNMSKHGKTFLASSK